MDKKAPPCSFQSVTKMDVPNSTMCDATSRSISESDKIGLARGRQSSLWSRWQKHSTERTQIRTRNPSRNVESSGLWQDAARWFHVFVVAMRKHLFPVGVGAGAGGGQLHCWLAAASRRGRATAKAPEQQQKRSSKPQLFGHQKNRVRMHTATDSYMHSVKQSGISLQQTFARRRPWALWSLRGPAT